MSTPFNPFAGLGQRTGATDTVGRGQSTLNARSAAFQPRGSGAPRGSKFRGRGRGAVRGSTRGRGEGPAGATSNVAAETAKSGRGGSTVAHSNQIKSFSALFGGGKPQQQSSFGVANGTSTATPVNAGRNAAQPWTVNTLGNGPGAPLPVEDPSVLNRYHERYEQVSNFPSLTKLTILENKPPDNPAAQNRSCETTREGNQGWTDGRPEPAYLVKQSNYACGHLHQHVP